jgi:sugar lactone lactonase YvrE
VAEWAGGRVLKLGPDGSVTTLATLGTPLAGIAVTPSGTVYVTEIYAHRIRQITAGGVVTTLAGGTKGSADGIGSQAQFYYPSGLALHASGLLSVADRDNHRIRRIDPTTGAVTTVAGSSLGWVDAQGTSARFNTPVAIALDLAGVLYVADAGNARIRKIASDGTVTTLAGSTEGFADGRGTGAKFATAWGIAVDGAGWVYVGDMGRANGDFYSIGAGNQRVRLVSPEGVVTTLAGSGTYGFLDGPATTAQFQQPSGLVVSSTGIVWVADQSNNRLRQVAATGPVPTITSITPAVGQLLGGTTVTVSGTQFVTGATVAFGGLPATNVTVVDASTITCRVPAHGAGAVTVVVRNPDGQLATVPGGFVYDAARAITITTLAVGFSQPFGVAVDGGRSVYVADTFNHAIRKVSPAGDVTTLAGVVGSAGTADGTGSGARFNYPNGLAVDAAGTVYVADTANHTIRKVTPTGVVTTLAGLAGAPGAADGTGSAARFRSPHSLTVDAAGTVYVADFGNHTVRRLTAAGVVTTLAGTAGSAGATDGTGAAARFNQPTGVAVDNGGSIYVADYGNHTIRKVTAAGAVSTLAGQAGAAGTTDGTGGGARLTGPQGIAIDGSGLIYVVDSAHTLRQVTKTGVVTTLATNLGAPHGVAVDGSGTLFVANRSSGTIQMGTWPDATLSIAKSGDGSGSVVSNPAGVDCGTSCSASFASGTSVTLMATPTSGCIFSGWSGGGCSGTGTCSLTMTGAQSVTATFARTTHTRYLAEGATSSFFDTRLALVNPGPTATTATVTFARAGASAVTTQVPVGALARVTIDPKVLTGLGSAEFSTKVESNQPLVIDRTVSWDVTHGYGAHAETAVAAPAPTWYLAEGSTVGGFNLFYLLQNPNAVPAEVRVRYLRPSGAPLEKTYTLPASSRTNIWVDFEEFPGVGQALLNTDVSAVVEVANAQPIIVERAMYFDVPGQTFGAGHESAGITAPAAEWFLAEGATGKYFDLFVLIANPGPADARVEATYLLPDGTTLVKPYTVSANSRFNIWVDYDDAKLADTAVSTTVRSTNGVPVIVERSMWWPDGGWFEAHNSPGATTTGTKWALAEGEVDASRNLETYILVANTSAAPADVKVTLLFEDGTSAERTYPGIPAKSRFNVPVGGFFPQAVGKRFGAIVESLGTAPAQIVVERAMYWDAAGQHWAAGTNALATKLQ